MTAPTEGSLIGARLKRPDGPPKLMGAAAYAADLVMSGLLHVRLVLSPHAHASITSVDSSEALAVCDAAMPGLLDPFRAGDDAGPA